MSTILFHVQTKATVKTADRTSRIHKKNQWIGKGLEERRKDKNVNY